MVCFGHRRTFNATHTPGPRQTFGRKRTGIEVVDETTFNESQMTTSTPGERSGKPKMTGTIPKKARTPERTETDSTAGSSAYISRSEPTLDRLTPDDDLKTRKGPTFGYRQHGNDRNGRHAHISTNSRAGDFLRELTGDGKDEEGLATFHTAKSVTFEVESEKSKKAKRCDTLV